MHLRDDERFKAVGPDALVLAYPHQGASEGEREREGEVWFDWAFVDFWKSNYCECHAVPALSKEQEY